MVEQQQISGPAAITQGRILTFAFIAGIGSLTAVALFIGPVNRDRELAGFLRVALLGLAAAVIGALPIVRKAVVAKAAGAVSATDSDRRSSLPTRYLSLFILTSALIEGVGMFGGVILLLTGDRLALVAVAAAIALLLIRLPSEAKLAEFARELRQPWG